MKTAIALSTLFLLLNLFVSSVQAAQFKLGEHYIEVEGKQTSTPQVTEFFSFYCPHCYKSEPFMSKVSDLLADSNQFKKVHVDSMPGRDIESEHMLTQALVTAELLKVEKEIVNAIFTFIHKSNADFSELKEVKNLFLLNGISSEDFDKTYSSFKVKMSANKMRLQTSSLRKQGITSVPTLIINGKFKPETKGLKSMDEYLALVKYLLTKTAK